jgi:hypothetical protein
MEGRRPSANKGGKTRDGVSKPRAKGKHSTQAKRPSAVAPQTRGRTNDAAESRATVAGNGGSVAQVRIEAPVADATISGAQRRQLFRAEMDKKVLTRLLMKHASIEGLTPQPISDDETECDDDAATGLLNC